MKHGIVSGWGFKSDWYRNIIQRTPEVTIRLGARKLRARAVTLSETEGAQELLNYAQHNPTTFRVIVKLLTGQIITNTEENCRVLARAIPALAFHP